MKLTKGSVVYRVLDNGRGAELEICTLEFDHTSIGTKAMHVFNILGSEKPDQTFVYDDYLDSLLFTETQLIDLLKRKIAGQLYDCQNS